MSNLLPNQTIAGFSFPKINFVLVKFLFSTLFVLMLGLTLYKKFPIFMDEALYLDIVKNFVAGKGFNTTLFKDFIPYVEQFSFWYPPIYFLVLAGLIKIFGMSIALGRLFSLACGLGVLVVIDRLAKPLIKNENLVLLVWLLLLTDHYFQDGSVVARMDILAVLLTSLTLLFHQRFLNSKQDKDNLMSGVFASLALLTHPTASIGLMAIGLNLLLQRTPNWRLKIKNCLLWGLPILLGLIFWLFSLVRHWDVFLLQNQVQMHRKAFAPSYVLEIFKYKPWERLILSSYFISNLFFVVRQVLAKKLQDDQRRWWIFLAFTSSVFPIVMKEMWYLLYISITPEQRTPGFQARW